MTLKIWLMLSAIVAVIAVGGYVYYKGGSAERAHQATEQLKQDKKVRKSYDAIDKATPFDADKRNALEWLYQYGRK